jgi:hypothetical protein
VEVNMSADGGGWLWILILVAVAVLSAALASGTLRWRRRENPTLDKIRDDANKRLYDEDKQ